MQRRVSTSGTYLSSVDDRVGIVQHIDFSKHNPSRVALCVRVRLIFIPAARSVSTFISIIPFFVAVLANVHSHGT